jgi:hypothetical protein
MTESGTTSLDTLRGDILACGHDDFVSMADVQACLCDGFLADLSAERQQFVVDAIRSLLEDGLVEVGAFPARAVLGLRRGRELWTRSWRGLSIGSLHTTTTYTAGSTRSGSTSPQRVSKRRTISSARRQIDDLSAAPLTTASDNHGLVNAGRSRVPEEADNFHEQRF